MSKVKGAARLRRWLDRNNMNQREGAAALEMHWTHINQLLTGRRKPGLVVAVRLLKICGIPVDSWSTPKESAAEALRRLKRRRQRRKAALAAAKVAARTGADPVAQLPMDELAETEAGEASA